MIFPSVTEFGAVDTKDRDCKNELQKAQDQVGDDQRLRLAARDGGRWLLVEARECHDEALLVHKPERWAICFWKGVEELGVEGW